MKIINITPGLISIPPNGWGAIEKIIWENHCALLNLGLKSEIKYLNEVDGSEDVVHIHVANLANMAHERGVPYYFMMHDHHSFLYGKESELYKENLKAIKNAKKAFVPAKYLVDYFEGVPEYFSHGVNTTFFKPENGAKKDFKLLCVANNGYASNPGADRKGFGLAIEMARHFNLPITIAGPKNNKNFFDKNLAPYDKLNIVYDLNEEQLLKIYQSHSIFIHMSELEAGHPNMTLLEAMACGLPVVGTLEANNSLDGMRVVSRDSQDGIKGLKEVIDNYDIYRDKALKTASSLDWKSRTDEMLKFYVSGEDSFSERLVKAYKTTKKLNLPNKAVTNYVRISFNSEPKVEIVGQKDASYRVEFIDAIKNKVVYSSNIKNGHWSSSSLRYYINWKINVYENNNIIASSVLDLENKKVKITIDSISLGDTLAWIGQIDKFQKKHKCIVHVHCKFKEILFNAYPNLNFATLPTDEYYASYLLGYFMKENWPCLTPVNPKTVPLCKVASDILGLEYEEIKPNLTFSKKVNDKKYVCIATQSTAQAKYWNNPSGWESVIKYLNSKGYEVWCVDKFSSYGVKGSINIIPKGAVDKTGDISLEERITQIDGADFFIGLSSGLSWLAWALDKPVVLISGFTGEYNEFYTPYRVFNEKVCNSCWNDPECRFDSLNWLWCPRGKKFECSSQITPEMVIEKINLINI